MKKLLSIVIVVVTALFGAPASSKDKSIVVTAPPTRAEWASQLGRDLDRAIRYPRPLFGRPPDAGLVSVVFTADADGRPSAARLVRSSKSYELDREALAAVGRMKPMLPKPQGIDESQRIRANILFATSVRDHENQLKLLRSERTRSVSRSVLDRNILVLNIQSAMSGGSEASAR